MTGTYSIVINGLEFRQSAYPQTGLYWAGAIRGLGKGDIRTSDFVNSGANGGHIGPQYLGMRQLPLDLVVHTRDLAGVETLSALVNEKFVVGQYIPVIIKTPTGRQFYLRNCKLYQSDPEIGDTLNLIDYKVTIVAEDPILYDYTGGIQNKITLNKKVDGGIVWDTDGIIWTSSGIVWADGAGDARVLNLGNAAVYPTVTIKGKTTNPVFTNMTTGRVLSFNITTSSIDEIKIDFLKQEITLNGTNQYGTLNSDDFWEVVVGENIINYTTASSSDDAVVELGWNNGYTGIF